MAKKAAKKATKTVAKKKAKSTAKKPVPSEEAMMGMSPGKLAALGLSTDQKASLRKRITNIQAHYQDMMNPFEYAKLKNVPLRDLEAFLVFSGGSSPALNNFRIAGTG
jgi:hypothetical protein